MLKNFYAILLLLGMALSFDAKAQPPAPGSGIPAQKFTGAWYDYLGYINVKGVLYKLTDTLSHPVAPMMIYWQHIGVDSTFWFWNMIKWQKMGVGGGITGGGGGSGDNVILPAGPTTTNGPQAIGFNPGTNITIDSFIKKAYYGTQPPTAGLTGGTTLELTGSPTVARTLSWTAGRGSNTPLLTSIVVAGVTQTLSQPVLNGSVAGTQAVSVTANTTTTYHNIVTASGGQSADATTIFSFLPRKYYGWVTDTTGIGSGSQDAVIKALSDQPLSADKDISPAFNRPISGTQFFVYIFPANEGTLTSLTFNGFTSLEAMNTTTHNFTNALGYTQSYRYYWNKQGQITESDIIAH